MKTIFNDNFYGATISNHGRENGFVDYKALKDSFNAVMCNSILSVCADDWEQIHGFVDNSEKIEELDNKKDELEEIQNNINDALEKLDDVENSIYDFNEMLENYDFEYEDADEIAQNLDDYGDVSDSWEQIHNMDFWAIREGFESFDSAIAEEIERIEAEKEQLENEAVSLENTEIFQYFIIDSNGAEILEHWTSEIVFYNSELDMYVWGITHFGTAWDYVLTDIKCETYAETAEREAEQEAQLEAYAEAEIEASERAYGCAFTKSIEATLDSIAEAEKTASEELEDGFETSISEYLDMLRNDKNCGIRDYTDEELEELNRLFHHNFKVGDTVFTRDEKQTIYRVLSTTNNMVEVINGDGATTYNKYDLNGFNSVGEEVRTPCSDTDYFKHRRLENGWTEEDIDTYLRLFNRSFEKDDVVVVNRDFEVADGFVIECSEDGVVKASSEDGVVLVNVDLNKKHGFDLDVLVEAELFDGKMPIDGGEILADSIDW